jgi:hypothetical protein
MSTGETNRSLGDTFRGAALEYAKLAVPAIVPWRMEANLNHPHKGHEQCGCAFCPDDDQETT